MIDINGHRAHRSVFADKIFHYSQFHCICNGAIASIFNHSTELHISHIWFYINIYVCHKTIAQPTKKYIFVWYDCCIWKIIFWKKKKKTYVEQSLCKLEPTCWPSVHLMHPVTWQAPISPTSIQSGSPSISITSGYCGCLFTEQWDCFLLLWQDMGYCLILQQ